jgi:hypothetical protein
MIFTDLDRLGSLGQLYLENEDLGVQLEPRRVLVLLLTKVDVSYHIVSTSS